MRGVMLVSDSPAGQRWLGSQDTTHARDERPRDLATCTQSTDYLGRVFHKTKPDGSHEDEASFSTLGMI